MSEEKKQKLTWFEPFSEKEAGSNESSGLLRRFLRRPQRSTVQIDEKKQSVRFENSTVEQRPTPRRVSTSEVESTGDDNTDTTVYASPPRTLSTVINRLDTLGRSKVHTNVSRD